MLAGLTSHCRQVGPGTQEQMSSGAEPRTFTKDRGGQIWLQARRLDPKASLGPGKHLPTTCLPLGLEQ
jgi:hypothetical protein